MVGEGRGLSSRILRLREPLLVFVAGWALMVFEIVCSRLMSPYFGSSIYTWSAVIASVMIALSVGYYLGGKLADKRRSAELVVRQFTLVAMSMVYVIVVHGYLTQLALRWEMDFRLQVLLVAGLLVILPSLLLGMIFPYMTRYQLTRAEGSGKLIGSMSMYSSLGSILGVLSAGFLLVPHMNVLLVVVLVGLIMVLSSWLYQAKGYWLRTLVLGMLIFCGYIVLNEDGYWKQKRVVKREGLYSSMYLIERDDEEGERYYLCTSIYGCQSSLVMNKLEKPLGEYARFFVLGSKLPEKLERVLFVGGAMMSAPIALEKRNELVTIDVVELEPRYQELMSDELGLRDLGRVRVINQDGRRYLGGIEDGYYDYIALDAFGDDGFVPFHMATVEYLREVKRVLSEGGVVVENVIGSFQDDTSPWVWAQYSTLKSVFPNVEMISMNKQGRIGNIMFVAGDKTLEIEKLREQEWGELLGGRYMGEIGQGMVLIDNLAPVELMNGRFMPNPLLVEKITYNFGDIMNAVIKRN